MKQLHASQANAQALSLELIREKRLAEVAKDGHQIEWTAQEQRCKRLTALLEAESTARRECENKALQFDRVSLENSNLQKEVYVLIEPQV